MTVQNLPTYWPLWQKIIFRILFLFLLFFTLDYLYGTFAFVFGVKSGNGQELEQFLSILNQALYWLDTQLYHIGYNPGTNRNMSPDRAFGIVLYVSFFILCLLVSAVWSWLDRKRPSYNQLNYWFRVYLRYAVAIIMLNYGVIKIMLVQMPYPNAVALLGRVGDQSHFNVLWNFMGASPGYQIFTGLCEVTASLLMLLRRSSVFGYLIMCAILTNVIALNIFYNVPVKVFSSLLLVSVLYLLAPFLRKLIQLFFYEQQVSFTERHYYFESKKTTYLLNVLGALVISIFLISSISLNLKHYKEDLAGRGKIYEVTSFDNTDTLPSNITDTLNWKRMAMAAYGPTKYLVIYYNNLEVGDWYYYDIDSAKKTFSIWEMSEKPMHHYVFNYDPVEKNNLTLIGKFKDYVVKIKMKPVMDSMYLNMEKTKLVVDY